MSDFRVFFQILYKNISELNVFNIFWDTKAKCDLNVSIPSGFIAMIFISRAMAHESTKLSAFN